MAAWFSPHSTSLHAQLHPHPHPRTLRQLGSVLGAFPRRRASVLWGRWECCRIEELVSEQVERGDGRGEASKEGVSTLPQEEPTSGQQGCR